MTKILVVFTGGTIGSRIEGATINVDDAMSRVIIEGFTKEYPDIDVIFDTVQPMNVLSENFTPAHWKIISDCVAEKSSDNYDGVIITHGSDTIPYTSAYMGFLFSQSNIPIVLTCSNHVLGHPNSNGQDNFNNSVLLIAKNHIKGVFSVFQDKKKRNVVYLATRMQEANPYDDQFTTFGNIEFGQVIDGTFVLNENPQNPKKEELAEKEGKKIVCKNQSEFTNQILAIKAYPGLNYNNFTLTNKTKAVLCALYHSSSNCVENAEFSLTEFISKCNSKGVDVYLMSFKRIGGEVYLTTKRIMDAGGIPLLNISFESAYVKLVLAYNQNEIDPKKYMQNEIYYENLVI
ncbi:MAG TPA: asparaginase [Clostridia bacterium]|nr:asparaginase [Clostridia bacterium]